MKALYDGTELASMDPLVLMKNLDHTRMTSRRLSYILQQQVHLVVVQDPGGVGVDAVAVGQPAREAQHQRRGGVFAGVDGGIDGKGKKALAHMNPLCALRYSATHVDKHNMVYQLDAVDAYEQKLVKQISLSVLVLLENMKLQVHLTLTKTEK